MSDPRDFERDPHMAGNRYVGREVSDGTSSGWIIAAVIAVILVGLAAYGYRGTEMSSKTPETTTGQSTRAPVPSTPPAAPVAPAPRPASPQ
jgi:hypothetical protein